ncbi:MAG: glycosyltransferase family 2 protein [Treponema sp.]|nr:glycosyltransferase family 2 protein [Treponema sp.]
MNINPLVSVLVPVYNIERYIGLCLESIIKQSYKNLEIIVVDDGSTDRSGEICDLYAKNDSRIKVIHKENGGLVSARKSAMSVATGEYVGYVDGDDWLDAGFFSAMIVAMEQTDSDAVVAGFSREFFGKSVSILNAISCGVYSGKELENLYSSMISCGDFFRHGITTYLWNKLFKMHVIKYSQLAVDERITIGEDGASVYPALLKSKRICVVDNCAYHYRQREDSMLKKTSSFKEDAERLSVLYDYLKKAFNEDLSKYGLLQQLQKYVLSTFIIRSGGIVDGSVFLPFAKNIRNRNVVVCGAGTFGQQLVNRFKEYTFCNVVAWVDTDFWEYRRCCLDVNSLSILPDLNYDYIVIGIVDSFAAQRMKTTLIDFGALPSKILLLNINDEMVDSGLCQYLEVGK